jgi:hypothetical protein
VSKWCIAFYFGLHDSKACNIKVFVSHKQFERVTTVFIHDCSGKEKQYLLDRLEDAALHSLTVHPLLIITIVMELLHNNMWEDVELMYRQSLATIHEAQACTKDAGKNVDAQPESLRALILAHDVSVHLWRMGQLREFAGCLREWIEEFGSRRAPENQLPFTATKEILLDRVFYLDASLREGLIQLQQAERYLQIYRQWVSSMA